MGKGERLGFINSLKGFETLLYSYLFQMGKVPAPGKGLAPDPTRRTDQLVDAGNFVLALSGNIQIKVEHWKIESPYCLTDLK